MKGVREPEGADKELAEKLSEILGGERLSYIVVQRDESPDNPAAARYRLFGNVGDRAGVLQHLANFIDGLLDDEEFVSFAQLLSRRALQRIGVTPDQLLKSITGGEVSKRGKNDAN